MTVPLRPGTPHSVGLRRDMEVLRELASEECLRRGGLGVVRIAERLGREKSQVSRALRALEAEGLVERDPRTRSYQLGWGLYTLAARGVETHLLRAAYAHVNRLAEQQRADVRLCVLIGGKVLTLLSVPPLAAPQAESPTETPCGPLLVLDWSQAELRRLVPPGALGHGELLTSLADARAHGYLQYPRTGPVPAQYAAAVRDSRGVVLAAIQLTERSGTDGDVRSLQSPTAGVLPWRAVVEAAGALSYDLGFVDGPRPVSPQE